jgi:type II secretory pathway component GspD/PulD (secretin)
VSDILADLGRLFPDGIDQVPHSAVAGAFLARPSRAYLRDTRDWLDARMDWLVRNSWVVPAKGPRGGKAWAITPAGRAALAREEVRKEKALARARRQAEKHRRDQDALADRIWADVPRREGLSTDGDTLVVSARLDDQYAVTRLIHDLDQARRAMTLKRTNKGRNP